MKWVWRIGSNEDSHKTEDLQSDLEINNNAGNSLSHPKQCHPRSNIQEYQDILVENKPNRSKPIQRAQKEARSCSRASKPVVLEIVRSLPGRNLGVWFAWPLETRRKVRFDSFIGGRSVGEKHLSLSLFYVLSSVLPNFFSHFQLVLRFAPPGFHFACRRTCWASSIGEGMTWPWRRNIFRPGRCPVLLEGIHLLCTKNTKARSKGSKKGQTGKHQRSLRERPLLKGPILRKPSKKL